MALKKWHGLKKKKKKKAWMNQWLQMVMQRDNQD